MLVLKMEPATNMLESSCLLTPELRHAVSIAIWLPADMKWQSFLIQESNIKKQHRTS